MPEAQATALVDLWEVRSSELDPMLEEEIETWREELDWDFRPSADLVRRFVDVHALNGYALMSRGEVVGYAYYVCEDHKGLVGDLYVREEFRTAAHENRLLAAVVEHLMRARYVRRIEAQLMLARNLDVRLLPGGQRVRTHPRNFMMVSAEEAVALPQRKLQGVALEGWAERWQDETAHLIASAYRGHVDSDINDQYRSAAGARRFLYNIVQYPGCGVFYEPAAMVAVQAGGRLCGVSLTSMVSAESGHVTQICVSPQVKGTGVGYELLRRSLAALVRAGVDTISLTVTAANRGAVQLYERVGFETIRQFPAFVWEGF